MMDTTHVGSSSDDPIAKKARKNLDLPSNDEQKQLQQMEILMRSNMLSLQTKELLAEVSPHSKLSSKKLGEWLDILQVDMQNTAKLTCTNREITAEWLVQQEYDLHLSSIDEMPAIIYQPPREIQFVGSFSVGTGTAPLYNVDIMVVMPAELFCQRDVLNHSYFDKRKLFLGALRKSLEQINKKDSGKRYKNFRTVLFKGDERKPLLQLQPGFSDSIVIRVIPTVCFDSGF
jgi:hypothetical protein